MIEYRPIRPGKSNAVCTCDTCGAVDEFCAEPEIEGRVRTRLTKKGWSVAAGSKLACPKCVSASRAKHIKPVEEIQMAETPALREPTREQKRQIVDLLGEVYDEEKQRYRKGDTDETVASVLGNGVMPGWVAKLREEFFGPDGGNEEIEILTEKVEAAIHSMQAILKRHEEDAGQLRVLIRQTQEMQAQLGAIKKAVGPRVLKLAGQS